MTEEEQGSPVNSAGMGLIKVLSSPQALTALVMRGEFRWAVAEVGSQILINFFNQ